jgi:hypothetical protein
MSKSILSLLVQEEVVVRNWQLHQREAAGRVEAAGQLYMQEYLLTTLLLLKLLSLVLEVLEVRLNRLTATGEMSARLEAILHSIFSPQGHLLEEAVERQRLPEIMAEE